MKPIRRGRSLGVRIHFEGRRKWIGSVTESCAECRHEPVMCAVCDAKAMLKATEMAKRGERAYVDRSELAGEFCDRWLTDYNERGTRWDESTLRFYRQNLPAFRREFAAVPLRSIEPSDARRWAQKVPNAYVRMARAMLNDAYRDDLIDRNPFDKLKIDTPKGRGGIVAITEDELRTLIELGGQTPQIGATVAAMIAVAGYTGIRPSELFALEPTDVQGDELWVRYQWNGHELKRPKSKKPRRVVLPAEAASYLQAVPAYMNHVMVTRADGERVPLRPLFRNTNHRPWRQPAWNVVWGRVRAGFEAKLEPARARELTDARDGKRMVFYELRHFAATEILRRGGGYDDAAHQLGHAKGETKLIAETYGHLEDSIKLDRVKRLYGQNVREIRSVDDGEAAHG